MARSPRPSDIGAFPRPSVAVDVAVVTVQPDGQLAVLVLRRTGDRAGQWALPGRFVRDRERLADSVAIALAEKCGLPAAALAGATPRQLHVFDDPARDDRGWVMSVAHLLGLPYERLSAHVAERADLALAPVRERRLQLPGRQRNLPYGQGAIVEYAVDELRRRYLEEPDPEGLLGADEFSLAELRDLHATVLDEPWQIDTFRRNMLPALTSTDTVRSGTPGRPAALYRRSR